jgi:[ribosomal protein S5]-alanine N-acetyltransferase
MNLLAQPCLHSARLLLRPLVAGDQQRVYEALSDPRVNAHTGIAYRSYEDSGRQMRWYAELKATGTGVWWAVCRVGGTEELIGAIGLTQLVAEHRRAEVGYWLLPDWWGQGLAGEALAALLAHAYGPLGLHRIAAEVDTDNPRSSALLERLGFRHEGIRRGHEWKDGRPIDLAVYARLASD